MLGSVITAGFGGLLCFERDRSYKSLCVRYLLPSVRSLSWENLEEVEHRRKSYRANEVTTALMSLRSRLITEEFNWILEHSATEAG